MEPVNFRMKGDVEGLPLHLQLPPALRQARTGDPFAILRPALKDLVLVESMRLVSSIDDAIWRVDVITAIDQISRNVKAMATFLGSTLVSLVERHFQIVGNLGELKSRSDIIEKLTSFQMMEAYYKTPDLSFKSVDVSGLDLASIQSFPELAASLQDLTGEDWQNAPWGPARIELTPSESESSTDSIAQIKRRMREEESKARRGTVPDAKESDGDDGDESSPSLKSSRSRIDLVASQDSQEEMENADDPLKQLMDDIEHQRFEYVQKVDEIAYLEVIKSQQSDAGASGDSLTRVTSQPWASIQDLEGGSIQTQLDEIFKVKDLRTSLRLVQDQLTMIVRNILRAFRLNPNAIERVLAEKQRTDPAQEFVVLLRDLRQLLFQRLLSTPAEEKAKDEHMREVVRRTDGYEKLRQRLEQEIQNVTRDMENKCKEMNDMVRKLQLDILTVEKLAEEYMQRTRQEGEKLRQAELQMCRDRRQQPLQDLSELNARLSKLREDHWDSESVLRRKKYKVETEIENWIKRFDEDMTELQNEFDEVEAAYNVEKAAMDEMEDRFEPMEAAFKEILAERAKLYRERQTNEREELRRLRAARAIQAWWRSYRIRKTIRIRNQKLEKQRLKALKKKGKKGKRGKKAKAGGDKKKKTEKRKSKK